MPVVSHILYLTRTNAYYMHREKLILLGRWPGDFGRKQIKLSALSNINISNNSLVTGPDVTSLATSTSHSSLKAISPAANASTAQHYYQQPAPHCVHPYQQRAQNQPVPGYGSTAQSDQYTAGHRCAPLGGSQAGSSGVCGEGRGGGDEECNLDTIKSITMPFTITHNSSIPCRQCECKLGEECTCTV